MIDEHFVRYVTEYGRKLIGIAIALGISTKKRTKGIVLIIKRTFDYDETVSIFNELNSTNNLIVSKTFDYEEIVSLFISNNPNRIAFCTFDESNSSNLPNIYYCG